MEREADFCDRVRQGAFRSEVYVYPTPRVYRPMERGLISRATFTRDVNVYVHFPFCRQICAFCGYLKTVDQKGELRKRYVDALVAEVYSRGDVLSGRNIKTLHFGGGTPSLMEVDEIEGILGALREVNPQILKTAEEISIEATPESVETDKFLRLKKLGFNRVSLGVQTLQPGEIASCRRKGSSEDSLRAICTLRQQGYKNIVVDLMVGIRGQTVGSFERSLDTLIELRPETVELYALGLVPNTKFGVDRDGLMASNDLYKCYRLGREKFLVRGYRQACHNRYEIPGQGSFLQEDYSFAGMSLIGFGAGARTYAENVHYRNSYLTDYHQAVVNYVEAMECGAPIVIDGVALNPGEIERQYIIYNIERLDKTEFLKRFGVSFEVVAGKLRTRLISLQFAREDGDIFSLTEEGLNYRDLIAEEFFSDEVRAAEEGYRPR